MTSPRAPRPAGGRRRRVTVPERAHPLVRDLFALMARRGDRILDVANDAGLPLNTVEGWKRRHVPNVATLEAVGNALGVRLAWVPIEDEEGEAA